MNYTSIEQSKKLLELGLSPENADMFYELIMTDDHDVHYKIPQLRCDMQKSNSTDIPCWSIGALLESAPKYFSESNHQFVQTISYDHIMRLYYFIYRDYQHGGRSKTISSNKNLFDGAFEMVVWLLENDYIKTE
ncbi:MAG: hypothetical protein IJ557_11350 [Bacteroidaceae bacterium]|nr:hypothetical protein [Bacteroidaceae bacterium]